MKKNPKTLHSFFCVKCFHSCVPFVLFSQFVNKNQLKKNRLLILNNPDNPSKNNKSYEVMLLEMDIRHEFFFIHEKQNISALQS